MITPLTSGRPVSRQKDHTCVNTPRLCARTVGAVQLLLLGSGDVVLVHRCRATWHFPAYSDSLLTQFPVWLVGPWVLQGNLPASGPR